MKIDQFLKDIEAVCRTHGLSIAPYDEDEGAFVIERLSEMNLQWLREAVNDTLSVFWVGFMGTPPVRHAVLWSDSGFRKPEPGIGQEDSVFALCGVSIDRLRVRAYSFDGAPAVRDPAIPDCEICAAKVKEVRDAEA